MVHHNSARGRADWVNRSRGQPGIPRQVDERCPVVVVVVLWVHIDRRLLCVRVVTSVISVPQLPHQVERVSQQAGEIGEKIGQCSLPAFDTEKILQVGMDVIRHQDDLPSNQIPESLLYLVFTLLDGGAVGRTQRHTRRQ